VAVAALTVDGVTKASMSFADGSSDTTVTLFGITALKLPDLA
jgi:hypothetical protein